MRCCACCQSAGIRVARWAAARGGGAPPWMGLVARAQEMLAEYGSGDVNYWSADTFNENVPPSSDPEYLRATSAAVYGVRPLPP